MVVRLGRRIALNVTGARWTSSSRFGMLRPPKVGGGSPMLVSVLSVIRTQRRMIARMSHSQGTRASALPRLFLFVTAPSSGLVTLSRRMLTLISAKAAQSVPRSCVPGLMPVALGYFSAAPPPSGRVLRSVRLFFPPPLALFGSSLCGPSRLRCRPLFVLFAFLFGFGCPFPFAFCWLVLSKKKKNAPCHGGDGPLRTQVLQRR